MMKNHVYRSILGRLPITNPTPQDMAECCPHLTEGQAIQAFTTGSGYVACPPLRVRQAFHELQYDKGKNEGALFAIEGSDAVTVGILSITRPPQLQWAYAGRISKYYANPKLRRNRIPQKKDLSLAVQFAEDNWGNELINDNWKSFLSIHLRYSKNLNVDYSFGGYPDEIAVLHVTLSRNYDDLTRDESKPPSEIVDGAILQMTTDPFIGRELKGGRAEDPLSRCAYCGSSFHTEYKHHYSKSVCMNCSNYEDPYNNGGWEFPLTPKMFAFFKEKGYVFTCDPETVRMRDHKEWELSKQRLLRSLERRRNALLAEKE